ncbi:MAG: hypothetical protein ACE5GW_05125 [Planctomycetota bacterium]
MKHRALCRGRTLPAAFTIGLLLLPSGVGSLTAQEEPESPAGASIPDAGQEEAIAKGVAVLLGLQEGLHGEGSPEEWPYEGVYRVRGEIPIGYRVGGTAICAWALLEAPRWDEDEARREAVARALDFILITIQDELMAADFRGRYDVRGWGHTYALSFLLRARELGRIPRRREKIVKKAIIFLIDALERTEIPDRGGWNYSRRGGGSRPSSPSTFMTAPTLQALFAAGAQGFRVEAGVLERALQSLEDARLETGAFQYGSAPEKKSGTGFEALPGAIGRMPVCETTLLLAGRGSTERVRGAIDAFFEHWEWLEKRRKQIGTHKKPYSIAPYYFFFAHYYAAQAIAMLPEEEQEARRRRLLGLLFKVREASGGWNDRVFPRSENFGTAMSLLALCQPKMPLPAGWTPAEKKKSGRREKKRYL